MEVKWLQRLLFRLFDAGCHYGHQILVVGTSKMKPYIFGERRYLHILDLSRPCLAQTLPLSWKNVASISGRVLFIGT